MAYAPSICRGDPEWRERGARQREPEPIFPAPLLGLARRLPTAKRGGGMAAPSTGLGGVLMAVARVFLPLKKETCSRLGR